MKLSDFIKHQEGQMDSEDLTQFNKDNSPKEFEFLQTFVEMYEKDSEKTEFLIGLLTQVIQSKSPVNEIHELVYKHVDLRDRHKIGAMMVAISMGNEITKDLKRIVEDKNDEE